MQFSVKRLLRAQQDVRQGRSVPQPDTVALAGGQVNFDGTVLYADLSRSSVLASDFQRRTAAKVLKSFLYCCSKLIAENGGTVTSFDGDRVMGVFVGETKNTNAVTAALKINYGVRSIVMTAVDEYFTSIKDKGFQIRHAVGIDTGDILAVRAGIPGANDLIWIGRAPNLAAALSDIREEPYSTFVSEDVFNRMAASAKYGGAGRQLMWEERYFDWQGQRWKVFGSTWTWGF